MRTRILVCLTILTLSVSFLLAQSDPWITPYEQSNKLATATWADAIHFYKRLAQENKEVTVYQIGKADAGRPLYLVTLSVASVQNGEQARANGKRVLFINNAIHPGEPCGVDACMMLARDLLYKPGMKGLLEHTVVCIIPMYNVGGGLNRGCCSRANQVGPLAYGFRGNARNLDLNRDFVKCDSRNALSFSRAFQQWLPDLFVDTHTTNGADYPAHITFIPTMPQKAHPDLAALMKEEVMPHITGDLDRQDIPSSVYVNPVHWGNPPEQGLVAFPDHPRYSSGYASLFGTLALISEAHMLKTFEQRVTATYATLHSILKYMDRHHTKIGRTVDAARQAMAQQEQQVLTWELDMDQPDSILFHGYTPRYRDSEVSGAPQLYYDRSSPFSKKIPYYQTYRPEVTVTVPKAYLIPQAYPEVIERLEANGIRMERLRTDTLVEAEVSYITHVKSRPTPWEGHFYHDEVQTRREMQAMPYRAGDYIAYTDQPGRPYLVHALEPESHDSYFRWNFFDDILMQKEWFSPYVFEPEAREMLKKDDQLRLDFEQKLASDSAFAANPWMRLYYLYQQSPHFEASYRRYPVGRLAD